jgi:hypothetical protein
MLFAKTKCVTSTILFMSLNKGHYPSDIKYFKIPLNIIAFQRRCIESIIYDSRESMEKFHLSPRKDIEDEEEKFEDENIITVNRVNTSVDSENEKVDPDLNCPHFNKSKKCYHVDRNTIMWSFSKDFSKNCILCTQDKTIFHARETLNQGVGRLTDEDFKRNTLWANQTEGFPVEYSECTEGSIGDFFDDF